MVSAVLAEDSSSASANSLAIRHIERASVGILKVYPAEGPFFYVRDVYLSPESAQFLDTCGRPGPSLTDLPVSESACVDLFFAARAWLAEQAAMGYLARSEYCRKQLEVRLSRKGFGRQEIGASLSYLESCGKLDDGRYASAWLRARLIHQSEGRRKLYAGLLSRGIASPVAERALDDFFVDADERLLCEKAASKLVRLGKKDEKLYAALVRKGFSGRVAAEMAKKAQEAQN